MWYVSGEVNPVTLINIMHFPAKVSQWFNMGL
jgi:hypothetical protein